MPLIILFFVTATFMPADAGGDIGGKGHVDPQTNHELEEQPMDIDSDLNVFGPLEENFENQLPEVWVYACHPSALILAPNLSIISENPQTNDVCHESGLQFLKAGMALFS